jgi:anti-sigma factor ChrR (cupin superfamily)
MPHRNPTDSSCELAHLYSLGALGKTERLRFEGHLLARCSACEREVATSEAVVSLLAHAAEPATPPPELRHRVLGAVAASDDRNRAARSLALASDTWNPSPFPGISIRQLDFDRDTRQVLMLVRAQPGACYPAHRHVKTEEIFLIEGELRFEDRSYTCGDYVRSAGGTVHGPAEARGGCLFLLRASLDDEVLA